MSSVFAITSINEAIETLVGVRNNLSSDTFSEERFNITETIAFLSDLETKGKQLELLDLKINTSIESNPITNYYLIAYSIPNYGLATAVIPSKEYPTLTEVANFLKQISPQKCRIISISLAKE